MTSISSKDVLNLEYTDPHSSRIIYPSILSNESFGKWLIQKAEPSFISQLIIQDLKFKDLLYQAFSTISAQGLCHESDSTEVLAIDNFIRCTRSLPQDYTNTGYFALISTLLTKNEWDKIFKCDDMRSRYLPHVEHDELIEVLKTLTSDNTSIKEVNSFNIPPDLSTFSFNNQIAVNHDNLRSLLVYLRSNYTLGQNEQKNIDQYLSQNQSSQIPHEVSKLVIDMLKAYCYLEAAVKIGIISEEESLRLKCSFSPRDILQESRDVIRLIVRAVDTYKYDISKSISLPETPNADQRYLEDRKKSLTDFLSHGSLYASCHAVYSIEGYAEFDVIIKESFSNLSSNGSKPNLPAVDVFS